MSHEDLVATVATAAILATVLQFMSGVLVCKQYVVNRSTGESSALPFLFGFTSTVLWTLYGYVKPDIYICFVNTIGNILMAVYLLAYFYYTIHKWAFVRKIILVLIFIMAVIRYTSIDKDKQNVESTLGLLACSVTLMAVAAPLSKLLYVIRVQSTDCLPLPMIVMSFFVSVLWYIYGCLQDDKFLYIPNSVGCLLTVVQLLLFVIYKKKTSCSAKV